MHANFNVILKISELCPLACEYCYYFRNSSFEHRKRPARISKNVVEQMCYRIMEYGEKKNIDRVSLTIHGGEPLSVGKSYFCDIVDIIHDNLKIPCELILQSNGVLIDEEWIEIFKKYNIRLGISIDGPREYQNINRKFKNGCGSFDTVDKNIRLCLKKEIDIGILMVADPGFDPQKIWNYLIEDLRIDGMDILVRDYTHDTLPSQKYIDSVSDYLEKWINIWIAHNDATIKIRIFDSIINLLLGKNSELEFGFKKSTNTIPTVTV